jgi:hypothetical protein
VLRETEFCCIIVGNREFVGCVVMCGFVLKCGEQYIKYGLVLRVLRETGLCCKNVVNR